MTVAVAATTPESFAQEWDALADRLHAVPWLRPGWFEAWQRAFATGAFEPLEIRRDGALVGVAPMIRRFGTLASAANWHTPSFRLLAADEAAEEALSHELFRRGARRVTVRFIPCETTGLRFCRAAARANAHRILERTLERSPYVSCAQGWDEYVATLDRKFLSELRRRRRLLEREGRLTVDVETGRERLHELLDDGFRIEAAAWKGSRGTAISSQGATQTFYREIAAWGAERGWLRLAFLRLAGRAIAFDFCFEADGVHYLLKTGYDPAYRNLGPGKLMRYEMILRAFSCELRSYEFLGANEPWKLEWTDACRDLRRLDAFSPSIAGLAEWAAFAHVRPLAKRLVALRHRSA